MNPNDRSPRFNLWPWLPVFVNGSAAIANGVIIMVANRVSPQKVEAQPYAASVHFDADKTAAEAFTASGHRLAISFPDPSSLCISIAGTAATGSGKVRLYRPDAPSADRTVTWDNVTKPLIIPLTRQGFWRIDLRLTSSDGKALAARTAIDTLTGNIQ